MVWQRLEKAMIDLLFLESASDLRLVNLFLHKFRRLIQSMLKSQSNKRPWQRPFVIKDDSSRLAHWLVG